MFLVLFLDYGTELLYFFYLYIIFYMLNSILLANNEKRALQELIFNRIVIEELPEKTVIPLTNKYEFEDMYATYLVYIVIGDIEISNQCFYNSSMVVIGVNHSNISNIVGCSK